MKKKILKLFRSLLKILLPVIFKILVNLKLNRRTINYLGERGYYSNHKYNFNKLIENLLQNKKIIALDVGANISKSSNGWNLFKVDCNPNCEYLF